MPNEVYATGEQFKRREHLRNLIDIYHRGKYGDYEDTYEQFEHAYFGDPDLEEDRWIDTEPVEKYASVMQDETYGMISMFNDLVEAMNWQAGCGYGGDTLNVPAGIYDLDTGKKVETRTVTMTDEAYAIVCAAVAPSSEDIYVQGIFGSAWPEVQRLFPVGDFRVWADAHGVDDEGAPVNPDESYYDKYAGE